MKKTLYVVFLCFSFAQAQTGPGLSCVCLEEMDQEGTISTATHVTNAMDGSGRVFVVEQMGIIWLWDASGMRFPEPFIDLSDRISPINIGGLHAVAFHPEYINNGLAYVWASVDTTEGYFTHVFEYQVNALDPNKLDRSTERDIFSIECNPAGDCHMGGMLLFGADGFLYFGHGDGADQRDPYNNGQNKSNPLGAIFRIDVDSRSGELEYGIPPDNPFLDDPSAVPEMYAYGFRNPYSASMDMGDRVTGEGYGRIFVADVGQDMWEEADILELGGNYGWSAYEGEQCYKPEQCGNIGPHIPPIAQYNHTHTGICIVSGPVYRGTMVPDLQGWYFFLDFSSSRFFQMLESSPGQWDDWNEVPVCSTCPEGTTNQYPRFIPTVGVDEQGEIYFAATDYPFPTGALGTRLFRVANPGTV